MIRLDGIVIEDVPNINFVNLSEINFSINEIYVSRLIYETGIISPYNINPSFVMDTEYNYIRRVISIEEKQVLCKGSTNTSFVRIPFDKLICLPLWEECREWLKSKSFYLNFHYDPLVSEENIKIGFIKPKSIIVEAEGKTDRECIYKVILEVVKYENKN
jgi:hypothetical protein